MVCIERMLQSGIGLGSWGGATVQSVRKRWQEAGGPQVRSPEVSLRKKVQTDKTKVQRYGRSIACLVMMTGKSWPNSICPYVPRVQTHHACAYTRE